MSVHQAVETVLLTIPNVPDEGAVVEELAVLLEEVVTQPDLERAGGLLGVASNGEELPFLWHSLIDFVTVYNQDDIRFTFKDGTVIRT